MELIYIVNFRIPTERAHGFQVSKFCEEAAKQGVAVQLVLPERENRIKNDLFAFYGLEQNFKVIKLASFDFFKYEKYIGGLAFYLREVSFLIRLFFTGFDKKAVIYTRNSEIAWLFSWRGFRTVFEAHNWPEHKGWLLRFFLKKVEKIVCNSSGTEHELQKQGFMSTLTAPNGVDLKKFALAGSQEEWRRELSLLVDKKIAMYLGHLYDWKGADGVVEAANILKQNENLLFVLVGGTNEDIKKYKELMEQKKLDNILFCGYQPPETVPKYLKCADILLLPNSANKKESVLYTSPIKMFEYMASGRPIIASDLPSIRAILNESNCVFFQADNPKSLAEKIGTLLADSALADKLSGQALADIKTYTWGKRAINILSFINS